MRFNCHYYDNIELHFFGIYQYNAVFFKYTFQQCICVYTPGGIVEITASHMILDGTIDVSGGDSFGPRAGGGAAGSVLIQVCYTI